MISQFTDSYRWLSNFYPCEIRFRGKRYYSVEYAYQSAKSNDKAWKRTCAEGLEKPSVIKKLSKNIQLVPDWEAQKVGVMRECLELKFSQEPFRTWLLETGNEYLQEGNSWGDTFWGVDLETGEGQNNLGKLIMEIRDQIAETG